MQNVHLAWMLRAGGKNSSECPWRKYSLEKIFFEGKGWPSQNIMWTQKLYCVRIPMNKWRCSYEFDLCMTGLSLKVLILGFLDYELNIIKIQKVYKFINYFCSCIQVNSICAQQ